MQPVFKGLQYVPKRYFRILSVAFGAKKIHRKGSSDISSPAFQALLARAPAEYRFLAEIARDGWAWEFLRRNGTYVEAWRERFTQEASSGLSVNVAHWDLCAFVDPAFPADRAPVFWSSDVSGFVLATSASPPRVSQASKPLVVRELDCDVLILDVRPGCQHVLFRDHGQRLQICVSGLSVREPVSLSALGAPTTIGLTRRAELRRALDHLIAHGRLPQRVHRPVAGAHRLLLVLLAVEAGNWGISPRETAVLLFGEQRVAKDWNHNGRALRAQLARAMARGRWLTESGFRGLLR